jgi:hypothetical protein
LCKKSSGIAPFDQKAVSKGKRRPQPFSNVKCLGRVAQMILA